MKIKVMVLLKIRRTITIEAGKPPAYFGRGAVLS